MRAVIIFKVTQRSIEEIVIIAMHDATSFTTILKNFHEFKTPTQNFVEEGIPYFVNEFWTSRQRQGHALHEISYRACFKAELPTFFIHYLSSPGAWVYDPFMGRGTTLIQAALMGRNAAGNDINPLSPILVEPRLQPVDYAQIKHMLQTVPLNTPVRCPPDLLAFYHKDTLRDLVAVKEWLKTYENDGTEQHKRVAAWINMVCINRLTGHSSGFFSGRTMPPNQSVSIKKQREFNQKFGPPPKRDVKHIILKKTRSLLRQGTIPYPVHYHLNTGKAWNTPCFHDARMDLVITSPPFADIVDYKRDNWLRCWFAGINAQDVAIDMPRSLQAWTEQMHATLKELTRILKPGGWIAFEVGEIRNKTVLLERYVWKAADGLPLEKVGVMINQQNFTKTSNCWGVTNHKKGTNTNRIVLLKKTDS